MSSRKPRHVEGGPQPSAAGRRREGRPLASTLAFDVRPPDSERTSVCWAPRPQSVAMYHRSCSRCGIPGLVRL